MTTSCLAASDSMRRYALPLLTSAVFGAAITLAPTIAHADDATAEALFQAGKALMEQKKYSEACPKLEASYKLDPAIGTKLNLADCHEKEGKLATAWGDWGEARDQAKRDNDKPRMDLAIRRQKELDPKVPKLTVTVTGPTTGLAVYRDELELESAMLGVPLPVDPGTHVVTLRRGKSVLREKKVDVAEKSTGDVTIDATGIPAATPDETNGASGDTKKQTKVIMVRRSKGMAAGGIILGTFGGIALITGLSVAAGTESKGAGVVVMLLGGGMLAGGIVLADKGLKKVPRRVEAFEWTRPTLLIGPTSVGFHAQF